jgi:hypothetical protein
MIAFYAINYAICIAGFISSIQIKQSASSADRIVTATRNAGGALRLARTFHLPSAPNGAEIARNGQGTGHGCFLQRDEDMYANRVPMMLAKVNDRWQLALRAFRGARHTGMS